MFLLYSLNLFTYSHWAFSCLFVFWHFNSCDNVDSRLLKEHVRRKLQIIFFLPSLFAIFLFLSFRLFTPFSYLRISLYLMPHHPSHIFPVLVSATATQADLPPDREAEGQRRGGAEGKLTVKVEFTENSLTYVERLLLKMHRRYF